MAQNEPARDDGWHDAEEARRRGDALMKRMLSMPPKPQEAMKLGKPRRGKGAKASSRTATDRRSKNSMTQEAEKPSKILPGYL
jgi:hypothetical protein